MSPARLRRAVFLRHPLSLYMKAAFRHLSLPAFALVLAACSSSVTSARLSQINDGMKTSQVEALLGRPTRIDQSEITGLTGQVYHYLSSAGDGRVVFVNGAVFETNFVPVGAHA
jgi:outer membrane protein assembly factor BamE (lipoprotein component of BamABCDE complex)